jgi:hypothetical protein
LQAFNKAALAVPEIEQCHMIASRFDYLLKVRTADIAVSWPSISAHCPMLPTPQPMWRWRRFGNCPRPYPKGTGRCSAIASIPK